MYLYTVCQNGIVMLDYLGHMKNTRRNTCTGARYAMPVRVNY